MKWLNEQAVIVLAIAIISVSLCFCFSQMTSCAVQQTTITHKQVFP